MRLAFVGDVMLGRLVNAHLRAVPPAFPWGDALPLLLQSDLRFCNLECALSDRGEPWAETPKTFHFRSDTKCVAVLEAAHMDAVSLANNHTLDYGYEALGDTLDTLDAAGIAHAGAGRNLLEAAEPARLERSGARVAFLAFTDNEPDWAAGPDRPGVYYVPAEPDDARFGNLLDRVRDVRPTCEILIVSTHWGPNWGREPSPEHVTCARALIENGADIVFGHSCHTFRGVGIHNGRPILYSTGDFIDDYAVDPTERNDQGFVYIVNTDAGSWRMCLHPTVIRDYHAGLAHGDEARAIGEHILERCAALGTPATWDPRSMCVRIAMPAPPPPPPWDHRHTDPLTADEGEGI